MESARKVQYRFISAFLVPVAWGSGNVSRMAYDTYCLTDIGL